MASNFKANNRFGAGQKNERWENLAQGPDVGICKMHEPAKSGHQAASVPTKRRTLQGHFRSSREPLKVGLLKLGGRPG
jgi:hypothetical protein